MNDKLLATAALFQITKDNVLETSGRGSSATTASTGKNRVKGVELGLAGNLTDKLMAHMGVTVADSEVLESRDADNVGKPKANFVKRSANMMLTYAATDDFKFGGTVTLSEGMTRGQPDAAGDNNKLTAGYGLLDLHASYELAPNMTLSANVSNVFDKEYVTATYRASNQFGYMGEGRAAKVNLKYKF